jgi:hypothetical protein
MSSDPFAQPSGNTATIDPTADPFGQPSTGGGFPKVHELFDALVLLTPIKIETVQKYRGKPGETQERLTADVVILDGPRAGEEYDSMYLSQSPIIKAAKTALRTGVPSVLGRVHRYPTNEDKKAGKYTTREDIEKALAAWRPGMGDAPSFAWALSPFDEDDAQKARAYLAAKASPFGN